MLLRSLQSINQLYIKYTENTLLIYDDDDDDNGIIVVIVIADSDDSDLRIKKKFSFK